MLDFDSFNRIRNNEFCNPVGNYVVNWSYLTLQSAHYVLYLKKKITTKK